MDNEVKEIIKKYETMIKESEERKKKDIIKCLYSLIIFGKIENALYNISNVVNQPHKNEKYVRFFIVQEDTDGEKLKKPLIIENDCNGEINVFKEKEEFADHYYDIWQQWEYEDIFELFINWRCKE